jgi:D-3-phosphoglycerate dehydrogenase
MKILFADKFPEKHLETLRGKGHHCVFEPELAADDLPEAVVGYDALIVRSTRVMANTIDAADRLKIVIRAGAGTNTIDKQAAADRMIYVCNVPGKNAIAVAELTMGLLLSIDRRIPENVMDLRQGHWNKKRYSDARGVYGKTMGIVGLGAVGLAVAERASAFGLRIFVIRKPGRSSATKARLAEIGVEFADTLTALAEQVDILTFHVPAARETRGLVGHEILDRMKPGGIVLNTSRGDIVDEAALIAAMDAKGIWAGLDVYAEEPASGTAVFQSALAQHPNVYGTHHIGASTEQAQDAVAQGVLQILEAFKEGKIINCVNMDV